MRNMRNINFKRSFDVKCFSSDTVSSSGIKTTNTDSEKRKLNTVTELFEQQGREFDADTKLISREDALIFPQVKGSTLNSIDVSLYEVYINVHIHIYI
jgi:co-chaperonin GroES (HSP10)